MATLNDFHRVDDDDDVLAEDVNKLMATSLRSEYKNVEALSGDMELTDSDTPIQRLDPDGSDRDILMPEPNAVNNHLYLIQHGGSANVLTIRDNDDTLTLATLQSGDAVMMLPDGDGGYTAFTRSVVLSAASPRVYTSSTDWTKPANLAYIIVEVVGGGGAGGGATAAGSGVYSCGGGGGGGGYSKKRIDAADLGNTETVTIGAGGTGVTGLAGNAGGTSSFGTHASATGGEPGAASAAASTVAFINAGAGGQGSDGDINVKGGPGQPGARSAASHGGGGGNSHLGGGGLGQTDVATFNGNAGGAYGGGGSGAANGQNQTGRAGAAGAAGVVIVWEYVYGLGA
jgi:hypothetical protein